MKPFYPARRTNLIRVIGSVALTLICSTGYSQPGNDACSTPGTILISGTTCTNTNGTMRTGAGAGTTATATPGIAATCGFAANSVDVWYRFQAQSNYPVITISGIGSAMDNFPGIALYTDAGCTGAQLNANLLGCVTGTNPTTTLSLNVETVVGGTGLTIGNWYKIRVMANSATTTNVPANWAFSICVVDRLSNDDCDGAITLPVVGSCGGLNFSIAGATLTTGVPGGCGGGYGYDVWFKFTATTTNPTIDITGAGANFTNRRVQLYRGTCGALISVGCGAAFPYNTPALTVGTTYYIRVYSTSATIPTTNAGFTICVSTANPPPKYGNSYVNISKQTNGGIVQNGDILEIRMTINHTSGTLHSARFVDNIPTNTAMMATTSDSIRVITNEGLTFRRYTPTPNVNNDAATYRSTKPAGHYDIKVNLGFGFGAPGATVPTAPADNSETNITGSAQILSSNNPRGGGGVLFAVAYRVRVTGNAGDTIKFGTGKFIYKATAGGADIQLPTIPYQILISNPMTLCDNFVGLNSAGESGGTFGAGTLPTRPDDLESPIGDYAFVDIATQGINDGTYSVIKNVSPTNSTQVNARKQPNCTGAPVGFECTNRMHGGYWDITGDHTGSTTSAGNAPPSVSTSSGYMMIVNADYVASEVFRQRLENLCPSTYYEFSAWIKNVCTACGGDSVGTQTYRPGVYPNLTFALDGIDRYSTGQVDTLGWLNKGFVFLTGDTQTTVTFSIRNNSQGGGGNDWAMDDIAVATCLPNMVYSPSANPNVCRLNAVTLYDTVRSHFDNYVFHVWQRSEDGGATWVDVGPPTGPASPTFSVARQQWEYLTHFVVPPWWADVANNGDLYRVVAATTIDNLTTSDCIFTSNIPFLTMNVMNCGIPLKTDLLSFNGKLQGDYGKLTWTTSKEDEPVTYQLERSSDGTHFSTVGTISSYNNNAAENNYSYDDPQAVTGKVYYRLLILGSGNNKKYSRIITLSRQGDNNFELRTVVNPFNSSLHFDISAPSDMRIDAELMDIFGAVVKRKSFMVHSGVNMLTMPDLGAIPAGNYIFRVKNNNQILTRKIVKGNNL